MADPTELFEIPIPCKSCGKDTLKTIAWIKANSVFICACAAQNNLDTDKFRKQIVDAQAELARVLRLL